MISCGKDSGSDSSSSSDSTTTSIDDTNPDPIDVTSCDAETGINKIICLADAFKATLTSAQLATVQLSYNKSNAIKWSNFPQALVSSSYKMLQTLFRCTGVMPSSLAY
ncbi:hypothetical protein SIO70_19585 [Chitinophaga sancti]|uniref:hypothetical protein n=1 Tax=Chitinophaga sancti TaxID=1004 RepID=UPI002A756B54|nr:hypothetical protein [Chitinophaga sancti]WPQ60555.1 hypothetical protein SIO70_19585 [Chitinophaga sancti]